MLTARVAAAGPGLPARDLVDEFGGTLSEVKDSRDIEFVAFLSSAQRLRYGASDQ